MRLRRWLLAAVAIGTLGGEARAHFLFIRIGPTAEAGRFAEVYFSEQAEAGDPRFVARIGGTQLWAQSEPGTFVPLEVRPSADRLRARLGGSGSVAVVGLCEYGVLARPGEVPFLLRYYPKAVAGRPEDLVRLVRRAEIPLEIMATVADGSLNLMVLYQGQPVPGAELHAVDADLTESEIKAGPDGSARWTPPAPGMYSIYTRRTTRQTGTAAGRSYDEVREFATLALDWPLGRRDADPEAVALFQQALAARAQWHDFPGFTAELAGEHDGRPFTGTLRVAADGTVAVQCDDETARPWLEDRFESIVLHRRADDSGGSTPVLRFADTADDHPLGRLLAFDGGRFASSYRIKDQQILVVNRRAGKRSMTITVQQNQRNAEGHYLPRSYLVHYWDAATGALQEVESVRERWRRVGSFDLPLSQTTTLASGTGFAVRNVELSAHKLLPAR